MHWYKQYTYENVYISYKLIKITNMEKHVFLKNVMKKKQNLNTSISIQIKNYCPSQPQRTWNSYFWPKFKLKQLRLGCSDKINIWRASTIKIVKRDMLQKKSNNKRREKLVKYRRKLKMFSSIQEKKKCRMKGW